MRKVFIFLASVFFIVCPLSVTSVLADSCEVSKYLSMPFGIHNLPSTILHEGSHWIVTKAFDNSEGIYVLPTCFEDENGRRRLVGGYYKYKNRPEGLQDILVNVAPYIVKLGTDRLLQSAYRGGRVKIDSFGDKYLQTSLILSLNDPLYNVWSKDSDLARLSRRTKIPRIIIFAAVQFAYIKSYQGIMKARGEGGGRWVFYVKF